MTSDEGATELDQFAPDEETASEAEETRNMAPEGEVEGDETEETAEGDDLENADDDDQSQEDDFEEIEHEGKKARIPAWLKPQLMMQADYTRKTQEVAEQRKALETHAQKVQAFEQQITQQAEWQRQHIADLANLHALDTRIQQYANLDWNRLEQEDFIAAQKHDREYRRLKDQRQELAGQIQNKEHQARQQAQHKALEAQRESDNERAKAAETTWKVLERNISGWNNDVAEKVAKYAYSNGCTREDLANAVGAPFVFIMLHKAMKYDQQLEKQRAAAKAKPSEQAKPLTRVKGRAAPAPGGLDDRLSADEWLRRRNEQVRKRA